MNVFFIESEKFKQEEGEMWKEFVEVYTEGLEEIPGVEVECVGAVDCFNFDFLETLKSKGLATAVVFAAHEPEGLTNNNKLLGSDEFTAFYIDFINPFNVKATCIRSPNELADFVKGYMQQS